MSMVTTFGSFSIAAGILLLFLIFVMLAAERRGELGIARAVGTRRRHLVQIFHRIRQQQQPLCDAAKRPRPAAHRQRSAGTGVTHVHDLARSELAVLPAAPLLNAKRAKPGR
jgi:FtsX-like permease family